MTIKNILILIAILGVLVAGFFAFNNYIYNEKQGETPVIIAAEAPTFTWKFEKAKSLNLDGNPNTNIFLEAKYANGKIDTKLIDTSAGSCNELPDADSDTLTGTANIQCYYAGAGERYKITKGEKSYFVERQIFEEGSPDYNPPEQRYEIVIEFPI